MPSFIHIIKDTSLLLVYNQEWQEAKSELDGALDQYCLNTFTATQTQGAAMNFEFFGLMWGVFGARRPSHDNYIVQMDGLLSPTFNGEASSPEFNQTLYSANANLGLHNLTVITGGNPFLDIDYIAFVHPLLLGRSPNMVRTFLGGTGHATTQPLIGQGYVDFPRDATVLYGPVGPNNTNGYSGQVDGGIPYFLKANKVSYRPQEIIFYAGALGGGRHITQVQSLASSIGEFAIDYATVYTAPSLDGSFLNPVPISHNALRSGTAAALTIITTLAASASVLYVYLF